MRIGCTPTLTSALALSLALALPGPSPSPNLDVVGANEDQWTQTLAHTPTRTLTLAWK